MIPKHILEDSGFACAPPRRRPMSVTAQPVKTEWKAGVDIHGRQVRLVRTTNYMGKEEWWIHRDAANQRDESVVLYSLSAEALITIGEIAKEATK